MTPIASPDGSGAFAATDLDAVALRHPRLRSETPGNTPNDEARRTPGGPHRFSAERLPRTTQGYFFVMEVDWIVLVTNLSGKSIPPRTSRQSGYQTVFVNNFRINDIFLPQD